jgi:hypothetical protein
VAQDTTQKLLRSRVGWVLEHIPCRPAIDDLTALHDDHRISDFSRKPHLVRDYDHGHSVISQGSHDIEDITHCFWIQRAGRFVEEHRLRVHGKSPCDRHTLLLTSGQLVWIVVRAVVEIDVFQKPAGTIYRLITRSPEYPHLRFANVLDRRHVRKQVVSLEDHPKVGPDPPKRFRVGLCVWMVRIVFAQENLAIDDDPARSYRFKTIQAPEQSGLTGPAWPDHRDHLPGVNA